MTFKDKSKQMFNAKQLLDIHYAAANLSATAMFEAGILSLGEDRYIGQEDGALPAHIKQMLKVLPLKLIFEVMSEQEKEKISGKESNKENGNN
jgi:hypothetical protein